MPTRGRHSSWPRAQAMKALQDIMTASWLCEASGGRKSVLLLLCFPEVFFANFWPRYAAQRPGYLSQHVHSTFFLPPSGLAPHAPTSRGRANQEYILFVPAWFAHTACEVTRFFSVKYIIPLHE